MNFNGRIRICIDSTLYRLVNNYIETLNYYNADYNLF